MSFWCLVLLKAAHKLFCWFGNHFSQTSLKLIVFFFFFSCVCEGTGARSIFLWCRCHARYMDLLIMLMWALTGGRKHCSAVRSSRDVLGGSAASQQVFLRWPSVAALVAAFRRKNKKRFLFFFLLSRTQQMPVFPLFFFSYYLSKSTF